jgi:hypothetical protein
MGSRSEKREKKKRESAAQLLSAPLRVASGAAVE